MHEASLVSALLRQVEGLVREHAAAGATRVNVVVGEFSGVEPDLLLFAFERQAPGTLAAGARLCIQRARLVGVCEHCSYEFPIERFHFQCHRCGGRNIQVTGGEELMLESVIMEAGS